MQVEPKVYLAQMTLRVTGRDGAAQTIAPGAVIDDFTSWPYDNQLSLLRLGQVKEVGGAYPANLTTEGGYLHFETPVPPRAAAADKRFIPTRPAPPIPVHDEASLVKNGQNVATDAAIDGDDVATKGPQPDAAPTRRALGVKATVVCPDCQKVCNGVRGLVLHRSKSHGEAK